MDVSRRRAACGVFILALLGTAGSASAQEPEPASTIPQPPEDPEVTARTTKARSLFDEGLALYEAGSYDAACPKLAESHSTEPAVRTLGLLAACHEKRGLVATAWRTYVATALLGAERADELEAEARARAFALEPRVPRLLIKVPAQLKNAVVQCDGKVIPTSELASVLHFDPGTIEVVVTADGQDAYRTRAVLKESEQTVVEVPSLAVTVSPPPAPPATPDERDVDPLVPIGIVTAALGLGSLGLGIGFGLAAKDANNESLIIYDTCAGSACESGRSLREDAQSYATVSTATFVGGLVAAAGGTVMFAIALTTPAESDAGLPPRSSTRLSFGAGHARLEGSW